MGLTEEEFGDLTYGLFEALLERQEERERKEFLRAGVIASAVINFGYARPEKAVTPLDFVPKRKEEEVDLSKLSPEEQAKHLIAQMNKKEFRHG